jgi:predicted phosphodiesterase
MSESERRIGVFSDVHGNLQALEAVLGCLEDQGVEEIFCCGDIVGYGGNPNECCGLLRRRKIPTVAGNHDHAALLMTNISFFNDVAKAAVLWTKDALTPGNEKYIVSLPLTLSNVPFLFVHASPHTPSDWNYVLTMGEAKNCFEHFAERFCFIGHSHQPFVIEYHEGRIACPCEPEIEIQPGRRYLINVGSVGQPRDRNPLACFATVDLGVNRIEFHRAPYDLQGAQQSILTNNLPQQLADRLNFGA